MNADYFMLSTVRARLMDEVMASSHPGESKGVVSSLKPP